MSGEGLRDALEKLAAKYQREADGEGGTESFRCTSDKLNALLAAHPAEPVGVSDEAVTKALDGWCGVPTYGTYRGQFDAMRAALEAAQPFMQPQVVASSEQIDALLWQHRTVASNGTQTVCACDRTWRSDTEHRTHLRNAVLNLLGGASPE